MTMNETEQELRKCWEAFKAVGMDFEGKESIEAFKKASGLTGYMAWITWYIWQAARADAAGMRGELEKCREFEEELRQNLRNENKSLPAIGQIRNRLAKAYEQEKEIAALRAAAGEAYKLVDSMLRPGCACYDPRVVLIHDVLRPLADLSPAPAVTAADKDALIIRMKAENDAAFRERNSPAGHVCAFSQRYGHICAICGKDLKAAPVAEKPVAPSKSCDNCKRDGTTCTWQEYPKAGVCDAWEPQPVAEKPGGGRECGTCSAYEMPESDQCRTCTTFSNWTPKQEPKQ